MGGCVRNSLDYNKKGKENVKESKEDNKEASKGVSDSNKQEKGFRRENKIDKKNKGTTFSIWGTVLNEDYSPVIGASLILTDNGRKIAVTNSEAGGFFKFKNVPPKLYRVVAKSKGYGTQVELVNPFYKNDIKLILSESARVVIDKSSNRNIRNVSITVYISPGNYFKQNVRNFKPVSISCRAFSNRDGKFSIKCLPYTKLKMSVYKKNYFSKNLELDTSKSDFVQLALRKSTGEKIVGKILDQNGKPVRAIIIVSNKVGVPVGRTTHSDQEGNFEIEDLKPGEYVIGAEGERNKFFYKKVYLKKGEQKKIKLIIHENENGR